MVIGSVETLIQRAHDHDGTIGQAMIIQEAAQKQISEEAVLEQMK